MKRRILKATDFGNLIIRKVRFELLGKRWYTVECEHIDFEMHKSYVVSTKFDEIECAEILYRERVKTEKRNRNNQ